MMAGMLSSMAESWDQVHGEHRTFNGRLGLELLDTMDRQVASDAGGGELRRHGDLLGEDPLDDGHAVGPHRHLDAESLTDEVRHSRELPGVEVNGSQEQHLPGGLRPAHQPADPGGHRLLLGRLGEQTVAGDQDTETSGRQSDSQFTGRRLLGDQTEQQ